MNASTAKIIGIVLIVLLAVGILKFAVLIPFGIIGNVFHGDHPDWFHRGDLWFWPVAGFGGLLALLYLAVAIWILVWVYKDAESRGLNGALWAILVFFLHLVGLIVYLLVRSGHPVLKPGTAQGAPSAPVPPQAPTSLPVSPVAAPPVQPSPPVSPACSKCGRPLQHGWVACPHCGEKL